MKKLAAVFFGVVFCLVMYRGLAYAVEKFAYIDVDKILNEYNKYKDYAKIMDDKKKAADKEVEAKNNELKQYDEKLAMLSEKERAGKKDEITEKLKAYEDFVNGKSLDLRKWWDEKMQEVSKDIRTEVDRYCEKEGFTFVFNRMALVYQVKGLDITDKILPILNGKYVKK
jgi:Skp family chaperone for outer membrane proteins